MFSDKIWEEIIANKIYWFLFKGSSDIKQMCDVGATVVKLCKNIKLQSN